eukprot:gene21852-27924_t
MGANDCTLIGEPVDLNSLRITRNMGENDYQTKAFSDTSRPLWRHNFPSTAHRTVLVNALPKDLSLAVVTETSSQKSPQQGTQQFSSSTDSHRKTRGRGSKSPVSPQRAAHTAEEESEQMSQMCYGESWNERENFETQCSQVAALTHLQRYSTQQDEVQDLKEQHDEEEKDSEEEEDEIASTGGLSPVMEISDDEEEEEEEDSDGERAEFVDEFDESVAVAVSGSQSVSVSSSSKRPSPSQTATRATRSSQLTQPPAVSNSQISVLTEESGRSSSCSQKRKTSASLATPTASKKTRGSQETTSSAVQSGSSSSSRSISSINFSQDTAESTTLSASATKRKQASDAAALKVAGLFKKLQPTVAALESQASQRREDSQSFQSQLQSQLEPDAFLFDSQIQTQMGGRSSSQASNHYNSQFQTQQLDPPLLSQDDIADLEAWLDTQHRPLVTHLTEEAPLTGSSISVSSATPLPSQSSLVADASMLSAALRADPSLSSPQSSLRSVASVGNSGVKKHVTIASERNLATQESFSYATQMPSDSQPSQVVVLINDNQHVENAIVTSRRGKIVAEAVLPAPAQAGLSPTVVFPSPPGLLPTQPSAVQIVAGGGIPTTEHPLIGRDVRKHFVGFGTFLGVVTQFDDPYFMVEYSDGDREEMTLDILNSMLVPIAVEGEEENGEECTQPQYTVQSDGEDEEKKREKRVEGAVPTPVRVTRQTRSHANESDGESAEQFRSRVDALLASSPALSTTSSRSNATLSNPGGVARLATVQKQRAFSGANPPPSVRAVSGQKRVLNEQLQASTSRSSRALEGERGEIQRPAPLLSVSRALDPARRHSFLDEEVEFLQRMARRPPVPFRGEGDVHRAAELTLPQGNRFIDDMLEFIFKK